MAENNSCKVAVIVVPDSAELTEPIEKLPQEVRMPDPATGIILIVPAGKMEEVRKVIKFNIDAYILKNNNAILRMHNAVKKLISEHNINVYRKRRNISLYVLLFFRHYLCPGCYHCLFQIAGLFLAPASAPDLIIENDYLSVNPYGTSFERVWQTIHC